MKTKRTLQRKSKEQKEIEKRNILLKQKATREKNSLRLKKLLNDRTSYGIYFLAMFLRTVVLIL